MLTFETTGHITAGFTSNMRNENQHYPIAYSQRGVYFSTAKNEIILYDSIEDKNVRRRLTKIDEVDDCVDI